MTTNEPRTFKGELELLKKMLSWNKVKELIVKQRAACAHEWHADQDNDCNFCVKCGARQEIYTE